MSGPSGRLAPGQPIVVVVSTGFGLGKQDVGAFTVPRKRITVVKVRPGLSKLVPPRVDRMVPDWPAVSCVVTVGSSNVAPPLIGPAMEIVITPPLWVSVGGVGPRPEPPVSVARTNVELAGTGTFRAMFLIWLTVNPLTLDGTWF